MEIRRDVPPGTLILVIRIFGSAHERFVSQGRMATLASNIVAVERVAWPGVYQPWLDGISEEEQICVPFDALQAASKAGMGITL